MNKDTETSKNANLRSKLSFSALRHPDFRWFFAGNALAMMADNIEHVISYWVIFSKFQSPTLAGFAVISHWIPFLFFSVWAGALSDKYDPRRVIRWGMYLFIIVSMLWGILFLTDTLEVWHAVLLLIVHGFAGVLWGPAAQLMIHNIVKHEDVESGVRLMATSRTLGILLGPAVGGGLMLSLGPALGIIVNTLIYLPMIFWLFKSPSGQQRIFNVVGPSDKQNVGRIEIISTMRIVSKMPVILSMTLLAGGASLFIGNAYQAQMPEFTLHLVAGDDGVFYTILLTASGIGALTAGIVLESRNFLEAKPRSAFVLVLLWCFSIIAFAICSDPFIAISILFIIGFLELSYNAMAQTLVQLHAPIEIRGQIIGLFSMSYLGLKTFSGITTGVMGGFVGIHLSLGLSAILLILFLIALIIYSFRLKKLSSG